MTFDLGVVIKVTQNVAHYPLHHLALASAMFEVATSSSYKKRDGLTHGPTGIIKQQASSAR